MRRIPDRSWALARAFWYRRSERCVDNARWVEARKVSDILSLAARSARRPFMSAMRQDPSQRSGPVGWPRVRATGEAGADADASDRGTVSEAGSLLSVVVPAKNE